VEKREGWLNFEKSHPRHENNNVARMGHPAESESCERKQEHRAQRVPRWGTQAFDHKATVRTTDRVWKSLPMGTKIEAICCAKGEFGGSSRPNRSP
jgi:hypothetical protein